MIRHSSNISGIFRFGRCVASRLDIKDKWRIEVDSAARALKTIRAIGGTQESSDNPISVALNTSSVLVLIEPEWISFDMTLWGPKGLRHHCDGTSIISPKGKQGNPCGCPSTFTERKKRAKLGTGPQVNTVILFNLAAAPEIGLFRFQSPSWRFAESIPGFRSELPETQGSTFCELSIQPIEFTSSQDRKVTYLAPEIRIVGRDKE
ncbi:hypothetical protein GCM10009801_46660 [Streptomyces albiaxialis]|uniref:Uncharacterized protein n=1 Tax=Streptomyces albiaxialis TaxID=329523 RepID=A0ABN2W6L6_9ACTN